MQTSIPGIQNTGQVSNAAKKISPADRDRVLWQASRQYMRGEITVDQLKKIENEQSVSNTVASSSR